MTPAQGTTFPALGTTADLRTWPPEATPQARAVLETELAAIDAACSRFRDDAELVGLNRRAGRWVPVSALLLEAVAVALRAARLTGGAVDPTIGRSLRLLGYDRDFAGLDPDGLDPDGAPLALQLTPAPGWQHVELDERRGRVRVPAGVELDLGATAKALAADRAARAAAASTGSGVLVSLGGDVATAGSPPPGGWAIRVTDDHRAPPSAGGQTVWIRDGGLATSSRTVRTWARGGERRHHVLDPATGRPAWGPWRTASVAAASCVDANTAATAALVLGGRAARWLEEAGLPARLVDGGGAVLTVAGWPSVQP